MLYLSYFAISVTVSVNLKTLATLKSAQCRYCLIAGTSASIFSDCAVTGFSNFTFKFYINQLPIKYDRNIQNKFRITSKI